MVLMTIMMSRRSLAAGGIDSDILLIQNPADFATALTGADFELILADYHSRRSPGLEALNLAVLARYELAPAPKGEAIACLSF